jgi:hypothetical protein
MEYMAVLLTVISTRLQGTALEQQERLNESPKKLAAEHADGLTPTRAIGSGIDKVPE